MPVSSYPLNDSHLEMLRKVQKNVSIIQPVIDKCKSCGLPTEMWEEQNRQHVDLASKLKLHFFGDQL